MIVLSESLLRDGVPQRDPLAIPRDLVHNNSMHFTFNKFWKRYGKFAKHLMKVCSNTYNSLKQVKPSLCHYVLLATK